MSAGERVRVRIVSSVDQIDGVSDRGVERPADEPFRTTHQGWCILPERPPGIVSVIDPAVDVDHGGGSGRRDGKPRRHVPWSPLGWSCALRFGNVEVQLETRTESKLDVRRLRAAPKLCAHRAAGHVPARKREQQIERLAGLDIDGESNGQFTALG